MFIDLGAGICPRPGIPWGCLWETEGLHATVHVARSNCKIISSLVPRFPLGLDSLGYPILLWQLPCITSSNFTDLHPLPAKSYELTNNFRAPGRKPFLGGCLTKMTVESLFPSILAWRLLVLQCLLAKLLCFPKGEWKAGTPSWSKKTGVSGKKTKLLFFLTVFIWMENPGKETGEPTVHNARSPVF